MSSAILINDYHLTKYKGLVDSFRTYEFSKQKTLSLNPEGHLEFIFQLSGEFAQKSVLKDEWQVRPQNFLGGLHNNSFEVKSLTEKAKILSVRFTPLGARSFLRDRLNLYKNSLVTLHDLSLPSEILLDQHHKDKNLIEQLDEFLSSIYQDSSKNVVDFATEALIQHKGFLSIQTICEQFNISPSYLRAKFNEQIGMSPKEYSRILRVSHATELLKATSISLTELSYKLGYFDQSHFIKDFKSVTGITPRKYLRA